MNMAIATTLSKRKLLFFVVLFSVFALGFKILVDAQQAGQGLEVSPPSQEVQADPGDKITLRATIRNKSNNSLPIKARLEDFIALGDQGQVELTEESPYSIRSWGKVSPESFNLGPGDSREVTTTITVPETASGGRYGSFVFGIAGDEKPGTASLAQEIASLFLLRISGPVDEDLAFLGFDVPKFSEFGPIRFSINVKNSGNVHVKSYGLINITDMFNRKVEDVVIYETNVFPEATRQINAELNKRFLLGRYTATFVLNYGFEKNQTLSSTATFYVFPLRMGGVVFIILVVLFLLRKRLAKALGALAGK